MINAELTAELEAVFAKVGNVAQLVDIEAERWLRNVAGVYVTTDGRDRAWWWKSLAVPCRHIRYEDDGLSVLRDLLKDRTIDTDKVFLVVTDDSPPPWSIYVGVTDDLLRGLRHCRFFEFFLAAQDVGWIIFDTHHSELVVVGPP
jgi:hypothetical protein